jgi:hypothetical protein
MSNGIIIRDATSTRSAEYSLLATTRPGGRVFFPLFYSKKPILVSKFAIFNAICLVYASKLMFSKNKHYQYIYFTSNKHKTQNFMFRYMCARVHVLKIFCIEPCLLMTMSHTQELLSLCIM